MPDLTEKTLKRNEVYAGRIIRVRRDEVLLPGGGHGLREVVEHPGGVAVFAMDDEDRVIMVRQFRYPMGEVVLELPAGKLEPGEDPRDSGLRELAEETGLEPRTFLSMGCSYSSPGILAEKIHLYFAKDLVQGPVHPDDGEFLEVIRVPYDQLMDMVAQGEIKDGKTLAGILKASLLLKESKG